MTAEVQPVSLSLTAPDAGGSEVNTVSAHPAEVRASETGRIEREGSVSTSESRSQRGSSSDSASAAASESKSASASTAASESESENSNSISNSIRMSAEDSFSEMSSNHMTERSFSGNELSASRTASAAGTVSSELEELNGEVLLQVRKH